MESHRKQKKIDIPRIMITALASVSIVIIALIFIFIFIKAWPVIKASGIGLLFKSGFDTQIREAFYSPADAPMLIFGMLGLLVGTVLTSGLALIVATVLGVGAAIKSIFSYAGKQQ